MHQLAPPQLLPPLPLPSLMPTLPSQAPFVILSLPQLMRLARYLLTDFFCLIVQLVTLQLEACCLQLLDTVFGLYYYQVIPGTMASHAKKAAMRPQRHVIMIKKGHVRYK